MRDDVWLHCMATGKILSQFTVEIPSYLQSRRLKSIPEWYFPRKNDHFYSLRHKREIRPKNLKFLTVRKLLNETLQNQQKFHWFYSFFLFDGFLLETVSWTIEWESAEIVWVFIIFW